ncbi:MAG: hypothetical protein AB1523_00160 [Bacillota bacterium]
MKKPYTEEKALVEYLKAKLESRGVLKLPRDWHLRNLSVARTMLDGENAPSVEEWKACIDWAFAHEFWGDKVDHLARVANLWPKYVLQKRGGKQGRARKKELIKQLYLS